MKFAKTASEWLEGTAWISNLTPIARDRVLADCYEHVYKNKEYVVRLKDPSLTWIGVIDGLLKVSSVTNEGRTVIFTAVPAGSWVGEGSVIKREPRRYELIAIRETRVLHMPRSTFMWLLETSYDFCRHIIDHLNERTGQFIAMIESSRISDPTAKVAAAICNLYNPVLYPMKGALLNISQAELGEIAGCSRATINTVLQRLKRAGLVHPEYGGILVLNVEELRDLAFREPSKKGGDGSCSG
ncbi:Crp/Fnr family transcriptional regulator [Variovorax paradoxus]|nr:Crp/Fnr family transcriptional regulator [Variovorax paradoxus]